MIRVTTKELVNIQTGLRAKGIRLTETELAIVFEMHNRVIDTMRTRAVIQ